MPDTTPFISLQICQTISKTNTCYDVQNGIEKLHDYKFICNKQFKILLYIQESYVWLLMMTSAPQYLVLFPDLALEQGWE